MNYFYAQGFKIADTKKSIQFKLTFGNNSIVDGPRITVNFRGSAKASDFKNMLPIGMEIHNGDVLLGAQELTLLKPKSMKLNSHIVDIYDLSPRAYTYLVTYDESSLILEDVHSTTIVMNHKDCMEMDKLRGILDQSIYLRYRTYPLNEYYSFTNITTSSASDYGQDLDKDSLGGYVSGSNEPIYLAKYSRYRLEYSTILVSFYKELKKHLPGFQLYTNLKEQEFDDSKKHDSIIVGLEGLGDRDRRPFMYDTLSPLIQSRANLSISIRTVDYLKFQKIKNDFLNLKSISNLTEFWTNDTKGLPWLSHVWWEDYKDGTDMRNVRDGANKYAYEIPFRCTLYHYIVEDDSFARINSIRYLIKNMKTNKNIIPEVGYKNINN